MSEASVPHASVDAGTIGVVGAIILAGGIHASPLQVQLGHSVLSLPLRGGRTLLGSWLDRLGDIGPLRWIRIVVSDVAHARELAVHIQPSGGGWEIVRV